MTAPWKTVFQIFGGSIAWLATDAAGVVYGASPVGVFASDDAGASWRKIGPPSSATGFTTLAVVLGGDQKPVLYGGNDGGIHRWSEGRPEWEHLLGDAQINALASSVDHDGRTVILAGTEGDGVLLSVDGGAGWEFSRAGLLDLTVLTLQLSPSFVHDRVALAGTLSGLYRSQNGGKSWAEIDLPIDDDAIECIAFSPNFQNDRLVLVGTEQRGLLRSADGGRTWDVADELREMSVSAIAFSGNAGQAVVLAADSQFRVSTNAGMSWSAGEPFAAPVMSLAPAASSSTMLAGLASGGVLRSDDSGRTWSSANSGLSASPLSLIRFSPTYRRDRTLFVAGPTAGVHFSRDGGRSWHDASDGLIGGLRDLIVSSSFDSDGTLFAVTTEGLLISCRASAWAPLGDVRLTQTVSFAIVDSPECKPIMAATLGDGTVLGCRDGETWEPTLEPKPAAAPAPSDDEVSLAKWFGGLDDPTVLAVAASPEFDTDRRAFAVTAGGEVMVAEHSGSFN